MQQSGKRTRANDRPRPARTLISIGLSLCLVVPALLDAGCASHAGDDTNAAIATLSSSGVAVYESYRSDAPIQAPTGERSAMRLTRWQLSNMLAQADARMGMLGADIDRLEGARAPKHAPPFSAFLGAWLMRGTTPLANYARGIMGAKNDYRHAPRITFPLLVITLFIADAARMPAGRPTATANDGFDFERLIAAPAEAGGVCSTVSTFISSTIADVESALTVTSGGFFAKLWNVAVTLVVGLAEVVINHVLVPLLNILTLVAGGLALITTIASTLQPWTVAIEEDPQSVTLGADPVDGKFTAVLHAPSIDWPSEVADCASVLGGVDLTKVSSKDAPVTWQTFGEIPNLATVNKKSGTVGDDNRAEMSYSTTTRDTSNAQCASPKAIGYLGARATVERIDIMHLQDQLLKLILNQLPAFVRDHLLAFFKPWIDTAETSFKNLLANPVMGTGTTEVWELQPDPLKCTPPPAATPPAANPTAASNVDDAALLGAWACEIHQTANTAIGPIAITVHASYLFNKDGTASGGSPMVSETWTGPRSVSAGTGAPVAGGGPYSYVPDGAGSGTLHIDGADRHLTWNGTNAWSTQATSSASHRTYTMQCARK